MTHGQGSTKPTPKRNAGGCCSFSLRSVPGTFDTGEMSKVYSGLPRYTYTTVGKPEGPRFRIPRRLDVTAPLPSPLERSTPHENEADAATSPSFRHQLTFT